MVGICIESAYENRNRSERERVGLMVRESERKRIREGARAVRGSENERDLWSQRIQREGARAMRGSENERKKTRGGIFFVISNRRYKLIEFQLSKLIVII